MQVNPCVPHQVGQLLLQDVECEQDVLIVLMLRVQCWDQAGHSCSFVCVALHLNPFHVAVSQELIVLDNVVQPAVNAPHHDVILYDSFRWGLRHQVQQHFLACLQACLANCHPS